ncbi:flagellar hook-basal body complex protein FliE [Bacillus sp. FJAT-49732]|uniref:Flagellar hook-basal body complex protein FliE n=1 Tax=Lederbergia citrisecunda TaxID=2833583 RepID=A0A942YM41_9BACI|nr:flagellar hook-basal body complex protein FliE [Lederbergia citrisecunda]MBS4198951.1 flagellar hook-basal body complex protein FliE [Lederbergia citrisecunda]
MPINSINLSNAQFNTVKSNVNNEYSLQNNTSFKDVLKNAINEVNNAQVESDLATEKLARGENIELHEVMITAQKASITMQAALEIRNKAVEAYQEMMRMQV